MAVIGKVRHYVCPFIHVCHFPKKFCFVIINLMRLQTFSVQFLFFLSSLTSKICILSQNPTLTAALLHDLHMIWTHNETRFSHASSRIIQFTSYHISKLPQLHLHSLSNPPCSSLCPYPWHWTLRGVRIAKIPWPDCMIKQPTDKVLVLEVARRCVPRCVAMRKEKLWYHADMAL